MAEMGQERGQGTPGEAIAAVPYARQGGHEGESGVSTLYGEKRRSRMPRDGRSQGGQCKGPVNKEEDVDRKYFKVIIIGLIIISIFLIVWMNQWKYEVLNRPTAMMRTGEAFAVIGINRITGRVYMLTLVSNGWRRLDRVVRDRTAQEIADSLLKGLRK